MNFKKLSEMNLMENEQIVGLDRQELITVYTTFLAMFMVQEMDKKTIDNRNLEQINTVELETLRKQSKMIRFQSDAVVNYMMHKLKLQTSAFQGEVNWNQLRQTLPELIPNGMQ